MTIINAGTTLVLPTADCRAGSYNRITLELDSYNLKVKCDHKIRMEKNETLISLHNISKTLTIFYEIYAR